MEFRSPLALRLRPPLRRWDEIPLDERVAFAAHLQDCEPFLSLMSVVEEEGLKTLVALTDTKNGRETDVYLRGVRVGQHSVANVLLQKLEEIGEEDSEIRKVRAKEAMPARRPRV